MKKLNLAVIAALSLTVAAPVIAADYVPYHKENLMTEKDPNMPDVKEVGLIDGIIYGIQAKEGAGVGTIAEFGADAYPDDQDGKHADMWRVTCFRDPMDDSKLCSLHKDDLAFLYRGGDLLTVDAGLTTPINRSVIETRGSGENKLYKNQPFNRNQFAPVQAMNAEATLHGGFVLKIRYTRNDGTLIYHEVSPKGFKQAADYMQWRYNHM